MRSLQWLVLLLILAAVGGLLTACDAIAADDASGALRASGVVEIVEVAVSSELAGRVVEVLVQEGDQVRAGAPLFGLDDALMRAQHAQAITALETALANRDAAELALGAARAAVDSALAGVDLAAVQYELALTVARRDAFPDRSEAWARAVPREFELPVWYFEEAERFSAAEVELEAARGMLELERENLEATLAQASSADLRAAEIRLSEAQAAFLVVEALSDRKIDSQDRSYMDDYIDTLLDAAEAELEDAQQEYDTLLTQDAAEDVLEVRARFAVAIERYETALDQRDQLLTGDRSLSVRAAQAAVKQAEAVVREAESRVRQARANVTLAEKAAAQAQAALDALQVQMDKLTVTAAVAGVVMTRSVEPGEMILPGVTALTIGRMDSMTITVYLPEDRYGEVDLGQSAQVSVDSFPGKVFEAVVIRISDRAEYTPRNVQTEEDRRTTVYAVELVVVDSTGDLKPGMPADVVFGR